MALTFQEALEARDLAAIRAAPKADLHVHAILSRVARMADHPIRRLYDAGVRVTLSTDDPLIIGSDLCGEFLLLYDAGVMSAAELDPIRLEALR